MIVAAVLEVAIQGIGVVALVLILICEVLAGGGECNGGW